MRELGRQVNRYITWREFRKPKIIPALSTPRIRSNKKGAVLPEQPLINYYPGSEDY